MRLPEIRRSHMTVAVISGLLFSLSFRLNQYFDDLFVYSAGISLLFLPAGVKLLAVLVGGLPAIAGIMVVSVYLGAGIWPDKTMVTVVYFAVVSLMTYPVAALAVMRLFCIHRDLSNLRYHHIVALSLAAVTASWTYAVAGARIPMMVARHVADSTDFDQLLWRGVLLTMALISTRPCICLFAVRLTFACFWITCLDHILDVSALLSTNKTLVLNCYCIRPT